MNIIIIEDEPSAVEQLSAFIRQLDASITIVAVLESVTASIQWLTSHEQPDLILSDIQLADGLCFEIYEQIQLFTPLIFTTASDHYAIRAFKHNSVDYLLKPIDKEALAFALDKFKNQQLLQIEALQALIKQQTFIPKVYRKSFLIAYRDKWLPIKTEEFAYFFIENGIVWGQLHDGRKYIIDQKLEELEAQLNPTDFIRANRQYIVARTAVTAIESYVHSRAIVTLSPVAPFALIISKERVSFFKKWHQGIA